MSDRSLRTAEPDSAGSEGGSMKADRWVLAGRTLVYGIMLLGAGLTLVPLVWLVAATTKGPNDLFHYTFFPPLNRWTIFNYTELFRKMDFVRALVNSVFVSSSV